MLSSKTEIVRFFFEVLDRVPGEAGGGGVGNPSVKGMTNKQFFKDGITETQQQVGFKIDKQLDLSFLQASSASYRVRLVVEWATLLIREWVGAIIGEGPRYHSCHSCRP